MLNGAPFGGPAATARRSHLLPALLLLLLVLADQLSKWWVRSSLALYEVREVVPGLFNLVHYTNTGAAFGLLAGEPTPGRRLFFVAVALLALGLLAVLYRQVGRQGGIYPHALALIAAGAVGNLIDRIFFGKVTDFLDFYLGVYHWPAFNIADSAITIGVLLFLWATLRDGKEEGEEQLSASGEKT